MRSPFLLQKCKAAVHLQVNCIGGIVALPTVGRLCARRVSDAAGASRLQGSRTGIAGLQDIPISSTPLPNHGTSSFPGHQDDTFVAPPAEDWAKHDFLMAGCESGKRLNVAVLLSGGVDSSMALRLLRAAGHTCRAFYLQIWFQEDFRNFWDACPWEEDLQYARQVCESLGVPLEVVPLTSEYWDRVVSSSVEEIRAGRTPNPDMWCNSRVKFGAFYDYLERTYGTAFDRVASGHYARVQRVGKQRVAAAEDSSSDHDGRQHTRQQQGQGLWAAAEHPHMGAPEFPTGEEAVRRRSHSRASTNDLNHTQQQQQQRRQQARPRTDPGTGPSLNGGDSVEEEGEEVQLLLTPDAVKDQTYFLANLSPRQLSRVMFPLGCLTKSQVRKLAAAADLANKTRKDSQGICFLGKVKFHEFVREHLGEWPGPILEAETGQPLGLHQGYWFYTVGQRGGIKLPGGPWYVVAKDTLHNAVLVSRQYYDDTKQRDTFKCGPFNWLDAVARPDPRVGPLFVKVRHGPNMYRCELQLHDARGDGSYGDDSYGTVVLEQNDQGLAAGQYAVFYQGGRCLGCAVIQETLETAAAGKKGQMEKTDVAEAGCV
ncbi:hypothetical protein Vretimale_8143 [Volvox reticuliferus]|uniref:tRNA-5-taurinomethyluridine 2-sulfurtransferase n=1 Tax=Volvox reticuliferus TaxID=1737510 RepID=A0A8J4GAB5_9CHLO|nr:hypothetical protein Vretifemale_20650 [Volvox reticuliferus]GIM03410.1 hypothetical protein Vretimale_8143 [Volvox reticuliferus]